MNVEIPAVPDERRTDNVFIAGGMDDCSLCDVTPGEKRLFLVSFYVCV